MSIIIKNISFLQSGGGGGGAGTPIQEANFNVPFDGVAFSRLD